jgi:hypothetical protein
MLLVLVLLVLLVLVLVLMLAQMMLCSFPLILLCTSRPTAAAELTHRALHSMHD